MNWPRGSGGAVADRAISSTRWSTPGAHMVIIGKEADDIARLVIDVMWV